MKTRQAVCWIPHALRARSDHGLTSPGRSSGVRPGLRLPQGLGLHGRRVRWRADGDVHVAPMPEQLRLRAGPQLLCSRVVAGPRAAGKRNDAKPVRPQRQRLPPAMGGCVYQRLGLRPGVHLPAERRRLRRLLQLREGPGRQRASLCHRHDRRVQRGAYAAEPCSVTRASPALQSLPSARPVPRAPRSRGTTVSAPQTTPCSVDSDCPSTWTCGCETNCDGPVLAADGGCTTVCIAPNSDLLPARFAPEAPGACRPVQAARRQHHRRPRRPMAEWVSQHRGRRPGPPVRRGDTGGCQIGFGRHERQLAPRRRRAVLAAARWRPRRRRRTTRGA